MLEEQGRRASQQASNDWKSLFTESHDVIRNPSSSFLSPSLLFSSISSAPPSFLLCVANHLTTSSLRSDGGDGAHVVGLDLRVGRQRFKVQWLYVELGTHAVVDHEQQA